MNTKLYSDQAAALYSACMPTSMSASMSSATKVIRSTLVALLLIAGVFSAMASQWTAVTGNDIENLLAGKSVVYEGETKASQTFHRDGTTTYVEGRPSLGNWKHTQGQYCSQWPPSQVWSCYNVFSGGSKLRFTSSSGQEWIGEFVAQ